MCGKVKLELFSIILGKEEIIELLVESGVDVNQRDSNNFTALDWAAAQDHAIAAEILINSGADVELVNNLQLTPLQLAVQNSKLWFLCQLKAFNAPFEVILFKMKYSRGFSRTRKGYRSIQK